jgi:hypothetical protein
MTLEVHSAPEDGSPHELRTLVALTQGMKPCWSEHRVAPLAFVVVPSRVVCPRCTSRVVRDVSSSLVCNNNLSMLVVCYVLVVGMPAGGDPAFSKRNSS